MRLRKELDIALQRADGEVAAAEAAAAETDAASKVIELEEGARERSHIRPHCVIWRACW